MTKKKYKNKIKLPKKKTILTSKGKENTKYFQHKSSL